MHCGPQRVSPAPQVVAWQVPATQLCPVAQRMLHAPQLLASLVMSAQTPPHETRPVGHMVTV
jgi:hypothetical protein